MTQSQTGHHPAFETRVGGQQLTPCGTKYWCCRACDGDGVGSRRRLGEDAVGCATAWADSFVQCLTCPEFIAKAEAAPRGWSGFVAEQAKAALEEALVRSTENMEIFFQIMTSLPDGLLTVNRNGAVNYFNPTAQRMTGLRVEEVIGRPCAEVLPDALCAQLADLDAIDSASYDFGTSEFSIHAAGREKLPVMSSASLIHDDNGDVVGAVEVFKDISVRRRLERDLMRSERKYRRIFENTKDMIFVIDKNGRLVEVNQACVDILDYASREELMNAGPMDELYVHPLHAKVFRKQIDRWGYIRDFETLFTTKSGAILHCLVTGNAIINDNKEVVGYEGIAKDITARMHAIQSLQRHARELSLLNAVALAINGTRDLHTALDTTLGKVLDVLGAKAGAVFLVDREKARFAPAAWQGGVPPELVRTCEFVLDDSMLQETLLAEGVLLHPESEFPLFRGKWRSQHPFPEVQMTCFLIPGKGFPLGFIALDCGGDISLKQQDCDLLGSLGNFLGGAIDNFMLQEEKKKRSKELKDLTARLFRTRETERERIARELHDEAGQSLTGINLALDSINKQISGDNENIKKSIVEVRGYINHTYKEMRRISHRLHPAILNDLGLEAALDAYFRWIIKHSPLVIDYKIVGFDDIISQELAIALYRLSQEAFTNTQKHAKAKSFKLSIVKSYPRVIFVAEDDGEGFDLQKIDRAGRSLGLVSMRERAAVLSGTFSLRSVKGQGTVIRIEIPLQEADHAVG